MQTQHEQYLQNLIDSAGILEAGQWLRVREKWEPGIVHALGSMADESLKVIRQELQDQQGADPSLAHTGRQARLQSALARITAERTEVVKELLADMVTEVARDTGEILTINGLAGDIPSLDARQFSGGAALEQAVAKSFVWFAGRVFTAIHNAGQRQTDPAALDQTLATFTNQWRPRLGTIARTVLHAAFNRVKHQVSAGLA